MWPSGKESFCQCRRHRFNPWVRKIPQRRKWQPTPVFLPGKSHGQKSLAGYSPCGCKESDTTGQLTKGGGITVSFFSLLRQNGVISPELLENYNTFSSSIICCPSSMRNVKLTQKYANQLSLPQHKTYHIGRS